MSGQVDLRGKVIADGDVDGIHVLNKTALKYTITEINGSFSIPVNVSDSLTFSGVKYKTKTIVISQMILGQGFLEVTLEERINELDEVIVGKILTGNLDSDITNADVKTDIDFYDLGLPGYKGPRMTQNEQKLYDADNGTIYTGLGVNVHKLLNRISGRTKKLRENVRLDNKKECIMKLKDSYSKSLFEKDELPENQHMDYFYFCSDDPEFDAVCKENNPLVQMEFLQRKLQDYKKIKVITSKD